jgi:RNA polymerase subunit RPABC4/transcription elongation factor Spt4
MTDAQMTPVYCACCGRGVPMERTEAGQEIAEDQCANCGGRDLTTEWALALNRMDRRLLHICGIRVEEERNDP